MSIISDFEEYYKFKFSKAVKLVKKIPSQAPKKISCGPGAEIRPRTPNVLDKIMQKNLGVNTSDPNIIRAAEQRME